MTRKPQNLGRAISIIAAFEREADALFEDLAAFHAPSECYRDVARGEGRRFRQVRRHACHVAGVRNIRELRRAVLASVPTWDRFNHFRLGINAI